MELFVVTFFIMALAVAGMAVGVIFGMNPIAGSCGGLNQVDGSSACTTCSRPCSTRLRRKASQQLPAGSSTQEAASSPLIRKY